MCFIEEEKELENGKSNSWIKGERKKHSWKRKKKGQKRCEEDEDERGPKWLEAGCPHFQTADPRAES